MADLVERAILDVIGFSYCTESNLWTNKNHNHCIEVEPNVYLHRKGATSSELDELGVIPANMRDGCFLVRGLGNPDFLNSSSHGAGRALSRTEAKKSITLELFQEQMAGIVAPVNNKTIDESPNAYKDIFEVMELQKRSVEVLKHLKPIINWKG
jgi:tRNA-splicing ligase RtcB